MVEVEVVLCQVDELNHAPRNHDERHPLACELYSEYQVGCLPVRPSGLSALDQGHGEFLSAFVG